MVGGHSAAAYPAPFFEDGVDAICLDDGERAVPALVDALAAGGRPLDEVPGWLLRRGSTWQRTPDPETPFALDDVPLPARHLVSGWRHRYACFHHRPDLSDRNGARVSVPLLVLLRLAAVRPVRARAVDRQRLPGLRRRPAIRSSSPTISSGITRRAVARWPTRWSGKRLRKDWMLVQTRVDVVARHPELLEAWRPIAREFDIFFGLEAATDAGLANLTKDTTVDRTAAALEVAREFGYGVTGNFVIDPDWTEADFERLWAFVETPSACRAPASRF